MFDVNDQRLHISHLFTLNYRCRDTTEHEPIILPARLIILLALNLTAGLPLNRLILANYFLGFHGSP